MPRTPTEQASRHLATALRILENAQSVYDKSDSLEDDYDRIMERVHEAGEYLKMAEDEDEDAHVEWKSRTLHGRNVAEKILTLWGDLGTSSGMPEENIRNGIVAYERLLQVQGKNRDKTAETHNAIANAYLRINESDAALENAQRALTLAPENHRSRKLRDKILNPKEEHQNIVMLSHQPAAEESSSSSELEWWQWALIILGGIFALGVASDSMRSTNSPWKRYFDPNRQVWYWHNERTGEDRDAQ